MYPKQESWYFDQVYRISFNVANIRKYVPVMKAHRPILKFESKNLDPIYVKRKVGAKGQIVRWVELQIYIIR